MIWPFTEEATSTAPAFSAGETDLFISGIVKVPVASLAIDDPEIRPVMAEDDYVASRGHHACAP
jgi:hypothetical protein